MFKTFLPAPSMSCPLCHDVVAPTTDSTCVIAWYTCPRCAEEWSARIRNGRPEVPVDAFAPARRYDERA